MTLNESCGVSENLSDCFGRRIKLSPEGDHLGIETGVWVLIELPCKKEILEYVHDTKSYRYFKILTIIWYLDYRGNAGNQNNYNRGSNYNQNNERNTQNENNECDNGHNGGEPHNSNSNNNNCNSGHYSNRNRNEYNDNFNTNRRTTCQPNFNRERNSDNGGSNKGQLGTGSNRRNSPRQESDYTRTGENTISFNFYSIFSFNYVMRPLVI